MFGWFGNDGFGFPLHLTQVLSTNVVQNICTAVCISTVQQVTTWRHPGLIFVYKTSPIFRGVLNPNQLMNCGTLPTSPCFARGPWEKQLEGSRCVGQILAARHKTHSRLSFYKFCSDRKVYGQTLNSHRLQRL